MTANSLIEAVRRTRFVTAMLVAALVMASPAYAQVVTSLSIAPSSNVTLPEGPPVQLRAMAMYSDGVPRDVTADAIWTVSDPGVLEAGAVPGVVRGIAAGAASVSASLDGFTASATYTVIASPAAGVSRAAYVYAARQHIESGHNSSLQTVTVDGSGTLTPQPEGGSTTKVHAMQLTRDSRYLFMLQSDEFSAQTAITVHRVDAGNGKLTPMPVFAFMNGFAGSLTIDPTGQFIYASMIAFPARVHGFRFDEQAATLTEIADVDADGALAMDPAGEYLYVAGFFDVRSYRIEPTGALTLASTTPASVIMNGIHLAVHDSGQFVYVAGNPNSPGPTVLMFQLTRATGVLTPIGEPVLLPIPMSAGNTAAQVMSIAIAGNFLYAGSYNDGLRSYAIDNDSGQLYELAVSNPLPLHDVRTIAAESGGQYLFVAGRHLNTGVLTIHSYALGIDGGLTAVGTFTDNGGGLSQFSPIVVANRPPAGVTLSALEVSPADKLVTISAPTGTQQFSAIGHYSDGSTAFFTSSAAWSSSNPAVGSIDNGIAAGLFTITGYGTTEITATVNGSSATTTFSVNPVPVTGLAMTTPSVSLPQGVPMQFRVTASFGDGTAHDVSADAAWSVSDPAVLELNATPGVVRGIGIGTATVTASYSGFTASATYTVIAPTVGAGASRAAFIYAARQHVETGHNSAVLGLAVGGGGALTPQTETGTTKIHAMQVTNDSRHVFMLQADEFNPQTAITVHRVDAGNGQLTPLPIFAFMNGWPGSLVIDPTGQFVYASTTAFPARLHAYRFDEQAVTLTEIAAFDAEGTLAMDPAGEYLYVAGAFDVRSYRIAPTGALTLASTTPAGAIMNGIRVAVHGSGQFVYVAGNPNSPGPTVLMFELTRATGELVPIGEPVLLPIPMSAGNTAAQVMSIAIAGNFLYAGSYNDGLRSYAIDNDSGQLYELAVPNPLPLHDVRSLAAETGGQHLFVAGRDLTSGVLTIHSYALGTDGGLTTVNTFTYNGQFFFQFSPIVVAHRPPAGVTLDALEVSPGNKQVMTGTPTGSEQFKAIGHYSDGSTAFFTASAAWSTSNPVVGSIDNAFDKGRFSITGYGTTTVTATANGLSASTTLSVSNAVLSLGNLHHVYDGTAKAATVTGVPPAATGLEVFYNGATQPPTDAGSYTVVARLNGPFYFAADATGTLVISKANPTITVVGYDVTSDGAAHTSTGTATGVLNETLAGLDLSATTHTAAGVYNDVWTFTDATGNYNAASGTVTNTIREASSGLSMIGFHQPVSMSSLNTVKGGSTVPLKFNIYQGASERKDLGAVRSFEILTGICSGVATEAVPFVTTGATSLRYDAMAGHFIQNWKTPATSGVCYQVTVTAADGAQLTAHFRTK